MANTFILGGSPLGLIGVQSRPTRDGMSTFNGGKSRNVNVIDYNFGRKQETNIRNKKGGVLKAGVSLFTGGSLPQFWGNIGKIGTEQNDLTGVDDKGKSTYKGINRDTLHNNDVYDTSVLNIIEKLSACPKASLRPQDFAYLKDLGVYPNNRLMIARKFASPQKDNILDKKGQAPLATIISWRKPEEDFLKITYGEEWGDAGADFTNVLNKVGEEFGIGGGGSGAGKGFNVLPLPGFTETLQRDFLGRLGILKERKIENPDGSVEKEFILPSGDPNLIKQAKQRKLVNYGEAASGLFCQVQIKMEAVYEQKFISGIDPTIAYMDILNNLVQFGTQKSSNYGLTDTFRKNLDEWTSNPSTLISAVITALTNSFDNLKNKITEVFSKKETEAKKLESQKEEAKIKKGAKNSEITEEKKAALAKIQADDFIDQIVGKMGQVLDDTVRKYKIEIMGIANALSGAPSTPWHITIGNPLRPVFCSGDMLTQRVTVDLVKDLAFNDLPSTIKVSFDLENARPWGLQEILAKFNTGYIRTVNTRKDFTISDAAGSEYAFDLLEEDFIERDLDNLNTTSSDGTPPTPGTQSNTSTKANENEGKPQNEQ
jgi:hypothetical protein